MRITSLCVALLLMVGSLSIVSAQSGDGNGKSKSASHASVLDAEAKHALLQARTVCEAYFVENKRYPDKEALLGDGSLQLPEGVLLDYRTAKEGQVYSLVAYHENGGEMVYFFNSESAEFQSRLLADIKAENETRSNDARAHGDAKIFASCCEAFNAEHGRYPRDLGELQKQGCSAPGHGVHLTYNAFADQKGFSLSTYHEKGATTFSISSDDPSVKKTKR